MLPRAAARLSIHPHARSWLAGIAVAVIVGLLGGCSSADRLSATSAGGVQDPAVAVSGLCAALAALPDRPAAERAFTNIAHDALHGLAADQRLDRALAAHILETMQIVEMDFGRSAAADALSLDLGALRDSASVALEAVGEIVPSCAG